MTDAPQFRRAREDDIVPAYALFRRTIFDYLHRIGMVSAAEAQDPPIASAWKRQQGWIEHLWNTAAANWVATDATGAIIGWALSIERAGDLELIFFFVDPGQHARGTGKRLLDLAFTSRPETRRLIVATQDAPALGLYLRTGVHFATTSFDFAVKTRPAARPTDLTFRPIDPGAGDISTIAALEHRIIGLHRETDLAFLARNRPGWIALRGGQPIGYVFGVQPIPADATDFAPTCGPMAALDPADLPDLIDHMLAAEPPGTEIFVCVPMANHVAARHLLDLGGKIDPFYVAVLTSETGLQLDRYIHTAPSFII